MEEGYDGLDVVVARPLGVRRDAAADEGVLPHEHHRLAAEAPADLRELAGADVVRRRHEHPGVLVEELAQLLVVRVLLVGLGRLLDRHRWPRTRALALAWVDQRRGRGAGGERRRRKEDVLRQRCGSKGASI